MQLYFYTLAINHPKIKLRKKRIKYLSNFDKRCSKPEHLKLQNIFEINLQTPKEMERHPVFI